MGNQENELHEYKVTCPWCWEQYGLWLETEATMVELIEDCQVCCHPLQIKLITDVEGHTEFHTERAM